MAAAVIFPDGSRWVGATGAADIDSRRAVTPDTPFVVGSITKTFVTALTMQLAEEGLIDLDAPLARWLPDYPRAAEITPRQLLNHTSGVFNYFEHPRYNAIVFGAPEESWTPEEILSRFGRAGYFEPGQGFHYSNTGFILLGLVIEEVTGNTLGEELRSRFFDPLGMGETYFQGDGPPPPDSAHGHLRRQSGHREISDGTDYRPTTSAATVAWAAGGVVASADDLATWGNELYGGDVLAPESLAQVIDVDATPQTSATYGLGTRTNVFQGSRAFGHTGSLRGFMAAMWHLPAEDVTVVVLTNMGRFDPNPIADRLFSIALTSP
ncbi:MAG TPA: serine hydrolase domain-containing protein [Candidatus Caenarcaniphilales bacterium]|nr:serine hydrolase domain-containing protein [Candidatus Caenarcaniphilales bacterium]